MENKLRSPTYIGSLKLSDGSMDNTLYVNNAPITGGGDKVDKVSTANKIYGTDSSGEQVVYDKDSFGKVDDVQVDSSSVVQNKIANITGNIMINSIFTVTAISIDEE